jgi:EARP and GARP complex-interacting protein 1
VLSAYSPAELLYRKHHHRHRQQRQQRQQQLSSFAAVIMFSTQSIDYSIGAPCRSLDCIPGHQDAWIVGTCHAGGSDAAVQSNTLQIIAYDADVNELHCRHSYDMTLNGGDGEPIRCLATLPNSSYSGDHDDDIVRVAVATEQGSSIGLYELSSGSAPAAATLVAQLTPDGGFGASIMQLNVSKGGGGGEPLQGGHYHMQQPLLLALDNASHLSVWDITTSSEMKSVDLDVGASAMQWDPHSADGTTMVAVGVQKTLHLLDWRTNTSVPTGIANQLHCPSIINDLDYNPNKPHTIAIATHDGSARIWDLRQNRRPVMTITGGHSHWMSSIAYNPCHDQLVLTTGTEGRANIWRLGSVSSAPLLQSRNRRVAQHTTSSSSSSSSASSSSSSPIYAARWAASEAWMYATVSWDGTMALHHVPSKEKYKILL